MAEGTIGKGKAVPKQDSSGTTNLLPQQAEERADLRVVADSEPQTLEERWERVDAALQRKIQEMLELENKLNSSRGLFNRLRMVINRTEGKLTTLRGQLAEHQSIVDLRRQMTAPQTQTQEQAFSEAERAFFQSGESTGTVVDTFEVEGQVEEIPRRAFDYSGYTNEELRVLLQTLEKQEHEAELELLVPLQDVPMGQIKHKIKDKGGLRQEITDRIDSIKDEMKKPERQQEQRALVDSLKAIRSITSGNELFQERVRLMKDVNSYGEDNPYRFYPALALDIAEEHAAQLTVQERAVYDDLIQQEYQQANQEVTDHIPAESGFLSAYDVTGEVDMDQLRTLSVEQLQLLLTAIEEQWQGIETLYNRYYREARKAYEDEQDVKWKEIIKVDFEEFIATHQEKSAAYHRKRYMIQMVIQELQDEPQIITDVEDLEETAHEPEIITDVEDLEAAPVEYKDGDIVIAVIDGVPTQGEIVDYNLDGDGGFYLVDPLDKEKELGRKDPVNGKLDMKFMPNDVIPGKQ